MATADKHLLFLAFQRGERWAENQIFDHFYRPLIVYVERITGEWTAAEDIATDTLVKSIEHRAELADFTHLRAYLYRLAHNAGINERIRAGRHAAVHQRLSHEAPTESGESEAVDNQLLRAELLAEIYSEIEALPDRCREIFKLIFVEELETDEIARRLGLNAQTVRSQKARAIGLIRTALLKKDRMATLLFFYACLHLYS